MDELEQIRKINIEGMSRGLRGKTDIWIDDRHPQEAIDSTLTTRAQSMAKFEQDCKAIPNSTFKLTANETGEPVGRCTLPKVKEVSIEKHRTILNAQLIDQFGLTEVKSDWIPLRVLGRGNIHFADHDPQYNDGDIVISTDNRPLEIKPRPLKQPTPEPNTPDPAPFSVTEYTKFRPSTSSTQVNFEYPHKCVVSAQGLVPQQGDREKWISLLFQPINAKRFHPELATIIKTRVDCLVPVSFTKINL